MGGRSSMRTAVSGDGNVDWQTDEPSDANGCGFITEKGGCGRIYGSGGERASEIAVGNNSGLLSGYWGQSDGSGIGMRNGMRMQQIADLRGFAARQQLKDELAYYQDGMGMSCQASGNGGTCGFKASNKSIQQAMSGAFALARGLDIAGEAIAVVTPLGDGVEIVDAIVEGDDAALAMAVGMAVVGLVPGVKGAKAAKKIADVADGAHDAAKAADALGGAAKAAKGGGAQARAKEIHGLLDPRAQRARTTAVTETADGTRVISSSERRLSPAQRRALGPGEVEGVGVGHAEVTGVNAARGMGKTPTGTSASRPICSNCASFLEAEGVTPLSPLK